MTRATAIVGLWTSVGLGLGRVAHADAHAVLVGVADYPEQTGWSPTETRDGPEVMAQLLRARGWDAGRIRIVEGAAATHDGILAAVGAELRERVSPGDRVVVYYTGHGGQIIDESGDEVDGLDEVLVPWDADPDGVERQFDYVTDDELGARLLALRRRLGPDGDLVVLLDACSTGSASRGGGTIQAMGAPQPYPVLPPRRGSSPRADWTDAPSSRGGGLELAPLTVLSAARSDQPTWAMTDGTGRQMGVFTASLTHALGPVEAPRTWGEVQAAAAEWMEGFLRPHGVSIPEPQLDGARHRPALTRTLASVRPALDVTTGADGALWLGGGLLYGVSVGDRIDLVPTGTRSLGGGPTLATGRVVAVDALQARVELVDGGVEGPVEAFVSEGPRPSPAPVSLGLGSAPRGFDPAALEAATRASASTSWRAEGAELEVRRAGRDALRLWHVASERPLTPPVPVGASGPLVEAAAAFARARRWWTLPQAGEGRGLVATVRGVEHAAPDAEGRCVSGATARPPIADGVAPERVSLAIGQGFVVDVRNDGPAPLWLTAIVATATGEVAALYGPTLDRGDPLPPGGVATLNAVCASTSAPAGPLLVHVFGTPEPLSAVWLGPGLEGRLPEPGAPNPAGRRGARAGGAGAAQAAVLIEVVP